MHKLFSRIHQSWLFVALCLGVVFGTILSISLRIDFFDSALWIIPVTVIFLLGYFFPNLVFSALVFVCGMTLAMMRTSGELRGEDFIGRFVNENVEICGTVFEDADMDSGKISVKLNNIEINDMSTPGIIYVQLGGKIENLERGDKITLKGKLNEGFGTFAGSVYRPEIVAHKKPEQKDFFLKLRDDFSERIKKYIPENEARLGLAYLLGMKNGLDDTMMEILKIVGLTHIVVASGTHLGIITEVTKKIFGKISRTAGVIFSLILIVVFGFMIGWTASITRAAIVTGLTLLMWYVGRKFEAWRIILIAMAITLLISPTYLINLGWLLSFASFIGILIVAPILTKFFFGEEKPKKVAEIIIATISAQVVCLPILIYYFGSISIISIVANVLILPTIPATMGMTFATGIFAIPFLGDIFGNITKILLDYQISVMEFFAEQKMFLIEIPAENPWVFLIYVPMVAAILIFYIREKRKSGEWARLR